MATEKKETIAKEVATETPVTKKKEVKKTTPVITDGVLVKVKSCRYGRMYYMNSVTKEKTVWEHNGDVQVMSVGALRAMRQQQTAFFKNQWIVILGVADGEACEASAEEICKSLIINQYYADYFDQGAFDTAYNWSESEIEERVKMLSESARENLIVALSGFVTDGRLDSRRKIKAFEQALGCDLSDYD